MPTCLQRAGLAVLTMLVVACSTDPGVTPGPVALALTTDLPTTARSGVALEVQPVIAIHDAGGQPVAQRGVLVTASLGSGNGSLAGTTAVRTDDDGRATFTDLAIAGPVGQKRLRFQAGGLGSVSSQSIELQAGPPASLALKAGSGQTTIVGGVVPITPQVSITDGAGNAVPGHPVSWTTDGDAIVVGGASTSDTNGVASVVSWQLGTHLGLYTLTAESPGLAGSPVTFVATATTDPDAPRIVAGDNQRGQVGIELGLPIVVRVSQGGNPRSGVLLRFAATAGGGSFDPAEATTDSTGTATTRWRLGPAVGPNTATVTMDGRVPTEVQAMAVAFKYVTAGRLHACGLLTTGQAYCWGDNSFGQLGDGTFTDRPTAVPVGGGLVFDSLEAAGNGHFTCGVTPGRITHCWGSNRHGQLGNGTNTGQGGQFGSSVHTPVQVIGGLVFRNIRLGGDHTCATTDDGTGYCWGRNAFGELGNGSAPNDVFQPTPVSGTQTYLHIATGDQHSCGVTPNGAAWCWGSNTNSRLGAGLTASTSPLPVAVSGGLTFREVSAGTVSGCGLVSTGAAYCWGGGASGQIGNGAFSTRATPTAVTGSLSFVSLSAKGFAPCAIVAGGTAYCWGENNFGEAGLGFAGDVAVPTLLAGGLTVSMVAVGQQSGCALTTGGAIYCWGPNSAGQVGSGIPLPFLSPTPVRF